jgi:hypothetical protein
MMSINIHVMNPNLSTDFNVSGLRPIVRRKRAAEIKILQDSA